MTMSGHEGVVRGIAYLPGGERIVTCSLDKTVRIWDVENGEQEGTSMKHKDRLFGLAVTRDGKRILSGGDSGRIIKVWDVETHELIEEWGSYSSWIFCVVISPDDQLAASCDINGTIVIREMREGGLGEIRHSIDAGSGVHSLCFSPNGGKLACTVGSLLGGGSDIHVYDVESGELVLGPLKGHQYLVRCVLWAFDGSQLFSASDNHAIRCWDSDTGESIGDPWTGHTDTVNSLSLSPDGTKIASASDDQTVRFWDAQSGDPIAQPLYHDNVPVAVTFSPSGEFVASGGSDTKVSIWRVPWWVEGRKQVITTPTYLQRCSLPYPLLQAHHLRPQLPEGRRLIESSSRPPAQAAHSAPIPIAMPDQHSLDTARNLNHM
jgi:WD40 repeat protein